MCPSFVLASLGLEFVFPKWEAGSGLWSASFYQFLADSHKADIPLRWAKRMLKSEVGVSRGQRGYWTNGFPRSHTELQPAFPRDQ